MADTKITGLTNFDSSNTPYWPPAPASDVIPIVDISDNTMAASGTTKKISINNLLSSSPTATGALTVTGLVTAGSATITGAATVGTTLGVTGVSTLASAVVTGALTSGTTTLVSHAAGYTGKVGIGTATPASTLHVKGTVNVDADYNLIDFYKTDGTTRLAYFNFRSDGPNYVNVNSNQPLYLTTNNTVQVQVETSGDVKIVTGNVVMGTSGKGIDFAAKTPDGSGTVGSEVLNDYEEGTFTPTVEGTISSGTASYNSRAGRYTKVGKLVTVQVYIDWTTGTGTGFLCFSGLPFTIANNADEYASATIGYINNVALVASSVPCALGYPSRTRFELNQLLAGGGANASVTYDAAGAIAFTATYFV